jgi:3-isopropylmalate dehydrogenase
MKLNIAVLPGDGIGPEVVREANKILDCIAKKFNHSFNYKEAFVGAVAIDKFCAPLPEDTLNICKKSDAILFGAIGAPKYDNNPYAKTRPEQGLLRLRKELELYANIRPVEAYDDLLGNSPLKSEIIKGTNMIIFRELTGGIYFGKKHLSTDGLVASDLCEYSKFEIERIAHLAFNSAQNRKRKLTLVDKANVLESSRLWRKVVTDIASQYKSVKTDYMFVDNAAMQLVLAPAEFDVILTENMFGDILSDECSVIGGSIGLLPSASVGNGTALFEPIHGSFPQAAKKNIANPLASILSTAMLLEHFDLHEEAHKVREAVKLSISMGIVTKDLNQNKHYKTNEVGNFISNFILS